jgi:hypothetical protein
MVVPSLDPKEGMYCHPKEYDLHRMTLHIVLQAN